MSDDSNSTDDVKTDDATKNDDATKANDDKQTDDKPKDKDDLSGLKSALAKERKRADQLEKEKRDADLSKLPELERAKTVADELTKENDKLKLENTKMKLGLELGLPWRLARRLSGDTEDEMREDAEELLKDYKPTEKLIVKDDPKNKRTTNDAKKQGGTGGASMNDLLRAAAGRRAS